MGPSGFTRTNRETTSERRSATRVTFPDRNTLLHAVQPGAIYLISEKQLVLLWHNLEARCGSLTCSRAGRVLWALAWRPWLLRLWQRPDWAPLLFLSFFFFPFLSFPVYSYWATVPSHWHGQGYNSCIYCVCGGASSICPALLTRHYMSVAH